MNKIKYLLIMIVALTVSVSCDDDDDDNAGDDALLGTWMYSESDEEEDYYYSTSITFKSNDTGTIVYTETYDGMTESDTDSFTWSSNGNTLTLELFGEIETVTYSISGNKLTINGDGDTIVFTKQ